MKTTVIIIDGEIELSLKPETELEKSLIESCKKEDWNHSVRFLCDNDYYKGKNHELKINLKKPLFNPQP